MIFRDTHEAIVDQETWDKAQRLRKRCPKRLPDGTYTHRLSGMVFCADCGSRMSFSSPEAKHRDSGVVYDSDSSWQCSKYRNMYVSCTSHFIKASTIEAAILEAVKAMAQKVLADEIEFAEQLRTLWESQNSQSFNEYKKELLTVQKRMDELDTLIRSLYESSIMGKIPERQFQRLMAQYDEEQTGCETRIAELKKELDNTETAKVDLKRFIKLIRKYKDCEVLTDDMLYELVEKVVIYSASGGRTIYRQQQIDIYFNFIGDTFPSQVEINHDDVKKITEQQMAKRKKYQKTSGENRKKKRAALREAAKTDPQAAAPAEQHPTGRWGRLHKKYLEEHHPVRYNQLILSGELSSYLATLDEQAEEQFALIIQQMQDAEGVTEALKAENQLEWVRRINSIRNRAEEIILQELIFT